MTRCTLLDGWLDAESKKLDEAQEQEKVCIVTGGKK